MKLSFETYQDLLIRYPINFPHYPVKLAVKLSGSRKFNCSLLLVGQLSKLTEMFLLINDFILPFFVFQKCAKDDVSMFFECAIQLLIFISGYFLCRRQWCLPINKTTQFCEAPARYNAYLLALPNLIY